MPPGRERIAPCPGSEIVDRITHHSPLYLLGGESYRLKQKTLS